MKGADKVICQAAVLLLLFTMTTAPASAQFAGLGGGGGGGADMMTQMAPMLQMMKAKMGKRRFGMLMQTMAPMMDGGGLNGMTGGGGFGGFGGGATMPDAYGMGVGDFSGLLGGNGGELMSMVPQLMRMANLAVGHRHSRRRH